MREPNGRRGGIYSVILIVGLACCGSLMAATDEANVAARLAALERALESRGLVDLLQQVEALQQEVQRLRGQIEEQTYTIDQLRRTQRETYLDIDQRMRTVENQSGVTAPDSISVVTVPPLTTLDSSTTDTVAGTPAPQSSLQLETQSTTTTMSEAQTDPPGMPEPDAASGQPAATVVEVPSIVPRGPTIDNEDSELAYREAFKLLKAGQYEESIAAFTAFLQLYPNSQYADNAQYWLGETNYVTRQFEAAIVDYRKLIDDYPQSKKRSHAMLKIGYSYYELGQFDQARAVLEDLRNRFPGTTAARLAEERIQRMLTESPN